MNELERLRLIRRLQQFLAANEEPGGWADVMADAIETGWRAGLEQMLREWAETMLLPDA